MSIGYNGSENAKLSGMLITLQAEKSTLRCEISDLKRELVHQSALAKLWAEQADKLQDAIVVYKADRDQAWADSSGWSAKCQMVEADLARAKGE